MLRILATNCGRFSTTRTFQQRLEPNFLVARKNHDKTSWLEDNLQLKVQDKSENETYVEAIPVPSGRENKVIEAHDASNHEACALCRLNLQNLSYTDVMILGQYIKKNGSLVTYHESKLCTKQYMRIKDLIKKAQRCNLIKRPYDYLVPGAWHDMNTYIERDRLRDQPMKVIKKEYWKI